MGDFSGLYICRFFKLKSRKGNLELNYTVDWLVWIVKRDEDNIGKSYLFLFV